MQANGIKYISQARCTLKAMCYDNSKSRDSCHFAPRQSGLTVKILAAKAHGGEQKLDCPLTAAHIHEMR